MLKHQKIDISIIIVNYRVKKELYLCIDSIISSNPKALYEIIVVDNDEVKTIQNDLKKKFPGVIYISNENKGFGQGNNIGVKRAQGKYLFFLNPDTKFLNNCIDKLVEYLNRHKNTAIVAPILFDNEKKVYQLQGTKKLTPIHAIFSLSFINKLFPQNMFTKDYWLSGWDKKTVKEVHSVPGTAFVIKKEIFEIIGGFDENFFLFFEESDLCNRVKDKGHKVYILPDAKLIHMWGKSTLHRSDLEIIFKKSRYYYFKKHFGLPNALIVEAFLSIRKHHVIILVILLLSAFLRFDRLNELMPLIGDQGWFYLSARDMITYGQIPLVGITSSHTWLHQGPLWTYILAFVFFVTQGNPVSPSLVTATVGVLTTYLMYFFGNKIFSQKVGLIAAALFAVSPLIIIYTRMPYHTTLIPLFILLFIFAFYKLIQGSKHAFPIITFLLSVLYNLELATVTLFFALFGVIFLGILQKKQWVKKLIDRKILLFSFITFSIPLIPIYVYDLQHGFPQTLKFVAWIGYTVLKPLLFIIHKQANDLTSWEQFGNFLMLMNKRLVFSESFFISIVLTITSLIFLYVHSLQEIKSKIYSGYTVLAASLFVALCGLILTRVPSEAYLPALFVPLIFTVSLLFENFLQKKYLSIIAPIFLIAIVILNARNLYNADYYASEKKLQEGYVYTLNIKSIKKAAESIIKIAGNQPFMLEGGDTFKSFASNLDNYKYVLLWKRGDLRKNAPLSFIIYPSQYTLRYFEEIVYKDHSVTIVKKNTSLYDAN